MAIIGCLPNLDLAREPDEATALFQAIKATATWAFFTMPRDHAILKSDAFIACLDDASVQICPGPTQGNIVLASSRLPTWPCPDEQLMVLEAAFIHLCHPGITTISFTSLLQAPKEPLCPDLRWGRVSQYC